jgi:putative transposase
MGRRKKGGDRRREAGAQVVTVNPTYTSQVCAGCGVIVEEYPSVRVHECPDCDFTADRDVNATRNITRLAIKPARTGRSGLNVAGYGVCARRSSPLHLRHTAGTV